ncbi:MAG: hypothetical protein GY756_21435 [bacterium]|nr:hypothetical protein [bacterium]
MAEFVDEFMTDCEWWIDHGGWGTCDYPERYKCSEYCPRYKSINENNEDDEIETFIDKTGIEFRCPKCYCYTAFTAKIFIKESVECQCCKAKFMFVKENNEVKGLKFNDKLNRIPKL